jgi:protoporphyrinogen oxidase
MTDRAKTFTLLDEQVDSIVIQELQSMLQHAERDLRRRKAGKCGVIFRHDVKEDLEEIKRHIDAFKTILKYWGANV